jgi:hypothetical protein
MECVVVVLGSYLRLRGRRRHFGLTFWFFCVCGRGIEADEKKEGGSGELKYWEVREMVGEEISRPDDRLFFFFSFLGFLEISPSVLGRGTSRMAV